MNSKKTIEPDTATAPEQLPKPAVRPGDLLTDCGTYWLKSVTTLGSSGIIAGILAAALLEAKRCGYRLIDRIQTNVSENILVFERLSK